MKHINFNRVLLIVLDSVGIGELPDAALYNDIGSNTLKNLANAVGGLYMPNMERLGLGNIEEIRGIERVEKPLGLYGKMMEISCGKDTTAGHWEIMGVVTHKPFPVYPNGFPEYGVINEFEDRIGIKILGNIPASGTQIIEELGKEHLATKRPIVYTSADSVFQIACHKDIYSIKELYSLCEIARDLLVFPHNVCRVIARPFEGIPGHFRRSEERRDYSLPPSSKTVMEELRESNIDVVSIGKIDDIFAHKGITKSYHTTNNNGSIEAIKAALTTHKKGLIFANLIDFDMLYGHRNDPCGYGKALEEFDMRLPEITELMGLTDMLIITADHGNDPTTDSTDHSREFVPVIIFSQSIRPGRNVGVRATFADIGATISYLFNQKNNSPGKNILENY